MIWGKMSIAHGHFNVVVAENFQQGKGIAARHHKVCCERMAQNVGKLATRKHDGGFVHHRQKLEVAIRKELGAVQGNDFLVKLFANRNASVLFAFGPDERDSVLCNLSAREVTASRQRVPALRQILTTRARAALALAVVQKLCDLFMHQPGHFFFGNSELTHVLQWVRCCPFSQTDQLAKHTAQ